MWIDEKTARERVRSSQNILNRVSRDEKAPADYPVLVPSPVLDSDVLPPVIDGEYLDAERPGTADGEGLATSGEKLLSTLEKFDDIDPEFLKSVRAAIKVGTRRPNLNHREAADAAIIGELTTHRHAGELYDRSAGHIGHISNHGNQNPWDKSPNENLAQLIEAERTKIRDAAYDRLNYVLSCLSNEKLNAVEKARELAAIASQLAGVADKMLPREMQSDDNVHFHIFRPEPKKQSDYEIVEVGEER